MKTYYHNTTAQDENIVIGYITSYGDVVQTKGNDVIDVVIKAKRGLLSAGESFEGYVERVGKEAIEEMGLIY